MLKITIPRDVYRAIAKKAAERNQSIVSFIIYLCRKEVGMLGDND